MICLEGECVFSCGDFELDMKKGENVFVPSNCSEDFYFDGDAEILVTSE